MILATIGNGSANGVRDSLIWNRVEQLWALRKTSPDCMLFYDKVAEARCSGASARQRYRGSVRV